MRAQREQKRHRNLSAGFSTVEIVVTLLIVVVIAAVGWYIHRRVAANKDNLTASNYVISYDYDNPACNSFKSPAANSREVQQSLAAYVAAGFSQQFVNSHFKLRSVNNINVKQAVDGVETDLNWEICYGSLSIPTQYQFNPGQGNQSPELDGISGKLHDITQLLPYSRAVPLLRACAGKANVSNSLYVSLGDPTGQGAMPPSIYLFTDSNDETGSIYAVDMGSGACKKQVNSVIESYSEPIRRAFS